MSKRKNAELFQLIEAGCRVTFREVHEIPVLTVIYFKLDTDESNNMQDAEPITLFNGPILNKRRVATASKQGAWTRALKTALEKLREINGKQETG